MKATKWEKLLDKAARSGDAAKVRQLLGQQQAQQLLQPLGRFEEEQAADFVRRSLCKAEQQNDQNKGASFTMKKRIPIAACVAAACLLCTAGAYASGLFTNTFFVDGDEFSQVISNTPLTQQEIDEMMAHPIGQDAVDTASEAKGETEVFFSSDEDMAPQEFTSAQQAQQASGIAPLTLGYLPEDMSAPTYQTYSDEEGGASGFLDTIYEGKDARRIEVEQTVFDSAEGGYFVATVTRKVDSTGAYTAKNGAEYQVYTADGVTTYALAQNNATSYIHFTGLSQQEMEQVIDAIA